MSGGNETSGPRAAPHLACPFCSGYAVGRLYVASTDLDSCECLACGARWDEERGTGAYRGRSDRASALIHRDD
ncbi:MAG TPA: hypothetical protein VMZ22_07145 [Acidimicrobiales bacterium]|nr:hypothetical protein [Acidimicrobiales bacterium]